MAGLPARGRALEQLRLIAADASSAELLAGRTLAVLDSAVPFDDGALFGVDESTLLFNRLLAYRGQAPEAMRAWLRDTYLVAREPGALHFPTLLSAGGGSATFHEDGDRWLRAVPPPLSARALTQAWRLWESPPGGALRYGLAHRHRWVAALQLARRPCGTDPRACARRPARPPGSRSRRTAAPGPGRVRRPAKAGVGERVGTALDRPPRP